MNETLKDQVASEVCYGVGNSMEKHDHG